MEFPEGTEYKPGPAKEPDWIMVSKGHKEENLGVLVKTVLVPVEYVAPSECLELPFCAQELIGKKLGPTYNPSGDASNDAGAERADSQHCYVPGGVDLANTPTETGMFPYHPHDVFRARSK